MELLAHLQNISEHMDGSPSSVLSLTSKYVRVFVFVKRIYNLNPRREMDFMLVISDRIDLLYLMHTGDINHCVPIS